MGPHDLIAAAIGIILGVILEDPLTKVRDSFILQTKRLFRKKRPSITTSEFFSFGMLKTTWIIIDGNGEEEYTPRTVVTHFTNHPLALPSDLQEIKDKVAKEESAKKKKGLPFAWNGDRYSIERFSITRSGGEENMGISFWFRPSDYYTFLSTNMQLDNAEIREKYLSNVNWLAPIPYFSNAFGVNLCVITSDESLILPKRSMQVKADPGAYHVSVNEGLSRSLDRGVDNQAPDMYRCGIRGIAEELGVVNIASSDITLLSYGIDTRFAQPALLGFAKVDKTTQDILDWRSRGVKDKWESDELHAVKFTVDDVVRFVFEHDPWTPMALACIYQTLVHEFGRQKVEKAIAHYSKK